MFEFRSSKTLLPGATVVDGECYDSEISWWRCDLSALGLENLSLEGGAGEQTTC